MSRIMKSTEEYREQGRYIVQIMHHRSKGGNELWETIYSFEDDTDALCAVHEDEVEDRASTGKVSCYRIIDTEKNEIIY